MTWFDLVCVFYFFKCRGPTKMEIRLFMDFVWVKFRVEIHCFAISVCECANSRCVAWMCVLVRSACALDMEIIWLCVSVVLSLCLWVFAVLSDLIILFLLFCWSFFKVVCSFYNMLVFSKVNFCSTHYSLVCFFSVYEKDHIFCLRIIKTLNYNNTKQRRLTQGLSSKYFTIVIVVEVVIVLFANEFFLVLQLFCIWIFRRSSCSLSEKFGCINRVVYLFLFVLFQ